MHVVGCFYILYSEGHIERVDHEYTYELIHNKINERIEAVRSDIKQFCYCSYEDSMLKSDIVEDDDVDMYFSALCDVEFIDTIGVIIDRAYAGGAFHTTSIFSVLYDVDLSNIVVVNG